MLVSGLTHGYTLCKKKKKVALIESVYKKKRKIKDTCWWVDGVIPGGGVRFTYIHAWMVPHQGFADICWMKGVYDLQVYWLFKPASHHGDFIQVRVRVQSGMISIRRLVHSNSIAMTWLS